MNSAPMRIKMIVEERLDRICEYCFEVEMLLVERCTQEQ